MDNGGIDLNKAGIDLSKTIYKQLAQKMATEFGATSGRKRPRNPQEKETLLRWERERGGIKIGTI